MCAPPAMPRPAPANLTRVATSRGDTQAGRSRAASTKSDTPFHAKKTACVDDVLAGLRPVFFGQQLRQSTPFWQHGYIPLSP